MPKTNLNYKFKDLMFKRKDKVYIYICVKIYLIII